MISRFCIDRPVLTWVLTIALMLAGLIAIRMLPVSQYPNIAPPVVRIAAMYPGAAAQVVEQSVTQVLEQELKGLKNLLYFDASSSASGEAEIMLTFSQETDNEQALIQVQNKVNQISNRLPRAVQLNGLSVSSMQNSFLMIAVFYDQNGQRTDTDISDWMNNYLMGPLSQIAGVGHVRNFGSSYAMRIWLDPAKLHRVSLMPSDVIEAIEAQNTEVPVGELGARPASDSQQLNVTITALSRLKTPQQFRDIVVKTGADGALVRLADVARVEIGNEVYSSTSRLNGMPASGLAIMLAPGANALSTADAVKQRIAQLAPAFPSGVQVMYPEDATRFVKRSISSVLITLLEAVALVVLVMFLFLQNWRATLIPVVTVPVVLLGTLAILAVSGYTINTLSLLGLVLAIGLLVDDSIVVVENVERLMNENGLDARTATLQTMREMTSALTGIALVLGMIFLPMAFFAGSVGVIYRQFSITLVSAMALSVLLAISLTPVLCVALLQAKKPRLNSSSEQMHTKQAANTRSARVAVVLASFAAATAYLQQAYVALLFKVLSRPLRFVLVYVVVIGAAWFGYQRLPMAFIPEDDQGTIMVRFMLPPGATYPRTAEVAKQIEHYFLTTEAAAINGIYTVSGFSSTGAGQNAGIAFVPLKDWAQRQAKGDTAQAIAARANQALSMLRDARAFAMVPPPIDGLGNANGVEFWLQDATALGHATLTERAATLVNKAAAYPELMFVDAAGIENSPQLRIDINQQMAMASGLDPKDVNSTLSTAWSGVYVNDFIHGGHVRKVFVQADAPYRSAPEDIQHWFVRGAKGSMTSFSAFASTRWENGPSQLRRFNGMPAIQISSAGVPGVSSGEVIATLEQLARAIPGTQYAWSGLSYQEKLSGGQAMLLYGVSALFIFLCLAALYESWTIPVSVMLVIPLGVLGAVAGVNLSGSDRDIFFQVGILTTMGLAIKNAILIVEFAESQIRQGQSVLAAVVAAARLRLRPILMTSLAFGAGIVPLVLANGPGAAAQRSIGASLLGGVISATALALIFVPLSYLLVVKTSQKIRQLAGRLSGPAKRTDSASDSISSF